MSRTRHGGTGVDEALVRARVSLQRAQHSRQLAQRERATARHAQQLRDIGWDATDELEHGVECEDGWAC